MQEWIDISVIVPVYNVEKYLPDCLDSILKQNGISFEIICVNDGSKDASLEILNSYERKTSKIKVYTTSNNGLSAARNFGIEKASGEFLYFLDSDDMLASEKDLADMVYQMREYDLDVLYFDGDSFFDDEKMNHMQFKDCYGCKQEYGIYDRGEELFARLVDEDDYFVSASLQCLRRVFIKEHGLRFAEGFLYEDNLFMFESILTANRVKHIKKEILLRRVREGSIMTSKETAKGFCSAYYIIQRMQSARDVKFKDCKCQNQIKEVIEKMGNFAWWYYQQLSYDEKRQLNNLPVDEMCKIKKWLKEKDPYAFPYHLFQKDDKVLLYAAGNIGRRFFLQGKEDNYVSIIGIVDARANEMYDEEINVLPIYEGLQLEYDKILITVENKIVASEIRENLIQMGVRSEVIKWDGNVYQKKNYSS